MWAGCGLMHRAGWKWVNLNQNFDDLVVGTISLFEISTTEGLRMSHASCCQKAGWM